MARNSPARQALPPLLAAISERLDEAALQPIDATAWFLGPKAENAAALHKFVEMAVDSQIRVRLDYQRDDPRIYEADDEPHRQSLERIESALRAMLTELEGSTPFWSYRNQSHMNWDITLPGVAGYFAGMLYNPNNVAAEASPVTTVLEIKACTELCEMLWPRSLRNEGDEREPWGHITCDGSIANGESMWAARNLKFLPVALAAAIATESELFDARDFSTLTCDGRRARLIDMTLWELLNLPVDGVIEMPERIAEDTGVEPRHVRRAIDTCSVQNVGLVQFHERFLDTPAQATPAVLAPATSHYSWPKSAALLGLGTDAVIPVEVDLDGRMEPIALRRALCRCQREGRPVLQVVAVMGTTEEGSVDPLADIVAIREEFRQLGLEFVIHVDGAWGGYFASMLRGDLVGEDPAVNIDSFPHLYLSEYLARHYAALAQIDSVTLDPHKSGFIPYPAGGLCYRNGDFRNLVKYTAPVVTHGEPDASVGSFGIEGSKPGAAAAAVYLSHRVIPLDKHGYGRLLGRCLFNSKRFYAALMSLDEERGEARVGTTRIHVIPFQRLPAEKAGKGAAEIDAERRKIVEKFYRYSDQQVIDNEELINDILGLPDCSKPGQQELLQLFQEIGSDLSIVAYAFNFSTAKGPNRSLEAMNRLNDRIYQRLSLQAEITDRLPKNDMFVTSSKFDPCHYGDALVDDFLRRAGVERDKDLPVNFLISTTQNPWLTSTVEQAEMLGRLMRVLGDTVAESIREIIEASGSDAAGDEPEES